MSPDDQIQIEFFTALSDDSGAKSTADTTNIDLEILDGNIGIRPEKVEGQRGIGRIGTGTMDLVEDIQVRGGEQFGRQAAVHTEDTVTDHGS